MKYIVMFFQFSARVDGLVKREETPVSLSEYFENREDFLSYRHALFGKRVKKFGPQAANNRPIVVSSHLLFVLFVIFLPQSYH